MEKVIGVNATINCKYNLEIQKTCWVKIIYHYSLKKKKMDIEAQKIALEKEV